MNCLSAALAPSRPVGLRHPLREQKQGPRVRVESSSPWLPNILPSWDLTTLLPHLGTSAEFSLETELLGLTWKHAYVYIRVCSLVSTSVFFSHETEGEQRLEKGVDRSCDRCSQGTAGTGGNRRAMLLTFYPQAIMFAGEMRSLRLRTLGPASLSSLETSKQLKSDPSQRKHTSGWAKDRATKQTPHNGEQPAFFLEGLHAGAADTRTSLAIFQSHWNGWQVWVMGHQGGRERPGQTFTQQRNKQDEGDSFEGGRREQGMSSGSHEYQRRMETSFSGFPVTSKDMLGCVITISSP